MKLISRNKDFYDGLLQSRRDGGLWKREFGQVWFSKTDGGRLNFRRERYWMYKDEPPFLDVESICQSNLLTLSKVIGTIQDTFPDILSWGRGYEYSTEVSNPRAVEKYWLAVGTTHYELTIRGSRFEAELKRSSPVLCTLQEVFNTPLIMVGQSFKPTASNHKYLDHNTRRDMLKSKDLSRDKHLSWDSRLLPSLEVNPVLANLALKCPFDQFEVVQSIEQWFANRAVPEVIPEPTDDIKIQSHGFDKRSFRKEPTKRRKP